ncbi:BnaC05g08130D [Brassica napus]|nr:BnaC05g08130D [Brassica napus]
MLCSENNSIAKVHSLVKTPLKKSLMINTSPPWPPITILTKILNQPVGNGDAAVARKKMANNMVEEEGLHNITAHGTTTSPLTKHMDESSGDNPMDELKLPDENSFLLIEIPSFSLGLSQEEMHVQNDYEVTLPPLCIEAMDSTTQFSRTHARLERAREIETFRLYSMTTTVIPRSKCFQVKTPTMLTKHTFLSEISWGRTRLSRLQTVFGNQARICVISPKVHSNFSSNAAGVIYSCSVSKL